MENPHSDKDQLSTLLRGLEPHLEAIRDLIQELNGDIIRAIQILIAKEAEMDATGKPRQKTHPDEKALYTR